MPGRRKKPLPIYSIDDDAKENTPMNPFPLSNAQLLKLRRIFNKITKNSDPKADEADEIPERLALEVDFGVATQYHPKRAANAHIQANTPPRISLSAIYDHFDLGVDEENNSRGLQLLDAASRCTIGVMVSKQPFSRPPTLEFQPSDIEVGFEQFVSTIWNICTLDENRWLVFLFRLADPENGGWVPWKNLPQYLPPRFYHQFRAAGEKLAWDTHISFADCQKALRMVPQILQPTVSGQRQIQNKTLGFSAWGKQLQARKRLDSSSSLCFGCTHEYCRPRKTQSNHNSSHFNQTTITAFSKPPIAHKPRKCHHYAPQKQKAEVKYGGMDPSLAPFGSVPSALVAANNVSTNARAEHAEHEVTYSSNEDSEEYEVVLDPLSRMLAGGARSLKRYHRDENDKSGAEHLKLKIHQHQVTVRKSAAHLKLKLSKSLGSLGSQMTGAAANNKRRMHTKIRALISIAATKMQTMTRKTSLGESSASAARDHSRTKANTTIQVQAPSEKAKTIIDPEMIFTKYSGALRGS